MSEDSVAVDSDTGKQILAHAFNKGDCVLEFSETDAGLVVSDITEHVAQLERQTGIRDTNVQDGDAETT